MVAEALRWHKSGAGPDLAGHNDAGKNGIDVVQDAAP